MTFAAISGRHWLSNKQRATAGLIGQPKTVDSRNFNEFNGNDFLTRQGRN